MPLPLILGIGAAIAGVAGVGSGIKGGLKMKEANDKMKLAESQHKENVSRFEKESKRTSERMDKVGQLELQVLKSFEDFTAVFEKIQNKPAFKSIEKNGVVLPKYDAEELKKVSVGAGLLLGGVGGAAVGTAGGFAAAGATTAAVMAVGTASTGTAISSLSGAAATNAILAALGGGSLAAGGGGIALGTAVLGGATLGVGLLVGGIIFNITGSSLSNKADEAWEQMKKAEGEIDKICLYLKELFIYAEKFYYTLLKVNRIYCEHFKKLKAIVEVEGKTDWSRFTDEEKIITENTVLLVKVLFDMCKVKLVLLTENENENNQVNKVEIDNTIENSENILIGID